MRVMIQRSMSPLLRAVFHVLSPATATPTTRPRGWVMVTSLRVMLIRLRLSETVVTSVTNSSSHEPTLPPTAAPVVMAPFLTRMLWWSIPEIARPPTLANSRVTA